MQQSLINFSQPTPLTQQLRQAAQDYLSAHQDHHYADKKMLAKLLLLISSCLTLWYASLGLASFWGFGLCYGLFIIMSMLLAVNVVHDASHHCFFRSRWANRLLNRIICVPLGIDPDSWYVRHVLLHHPYVNIQNCDPDIDENHLLRQTPFQKRYGFMRWQHLYWPLVASLTFPATIWYFDWVERFNRHNRVNALLPRQGWPGITLFLLAKASHLLFTIIMPIIYGHTISLVLTVYLASQMFSSLIFVMLIIGTHWAKGQFYQPPADHKIPHSVTEHILATSCDWGVGSDRVTYWLGGLNLHLTHHLFPGFSHRHYPALAKIIARHSSDYQYISLMEFFIAQQRYLKGLGQQD